MRKLFSLILIFLLKKAFEGKTRPLIELEIANLYKRSKKENFYIKTEIVKVKKGERRFFVAYFEDANQKTKCHLGRYRLDTPITVAIN